jgi:hypothetical protein
MDKARSLERTADWKTIAALWKIRPGLPIILASSYDEQSVIADDHKEMPQAFLQKLRCSKNETTHAQYPPSAGLFEND